MSTRAPKLGLGWLSDLAGEIAAVAAVPVAIVLALGLKPQAESGDKRTEPFWLNASHAPKCPACQLVIHQAKAPAETPLVEAPLLISVALPIDSAIGSAAPRHDADPVQVEVPRVSVLVGRSHRPPDQDGFNGDVLDIDAALAGLAGADPQAAELVKLRYFAGLSIPEAAAVLRISPRSADFLWAYARAWLLRLLGTADARE